MLAKCPYCQEVIDSQAQICAKCQGILSIGSFEAIRQALHINPKLALRDRETIAELTSAVRNIEASRAQFEQERQEQQLRARQAEEAAIQVRRIAEQEAAAKAEAERIRIKEERARADQQREENERLRIEGLHPTARWVLTHKRQTKILAASLVAVLLLSFAGVKKHAADVAAQARELELIQIQKALCANEVPKIKRKQKVLANARARYYRLEDKTNAWWETYGLNRPQLNALYDQYYARANSMPSSDWADEQMNKHNRMEERTNKALFINLINTMKPIHEMQKNTYAQYLDATHQTNMNLKTKAWLALERVHSREVSLYGLATIMRNQIRNEVGFESFMQFIEPFFTSIETNDATGEYKRVLAFDTVYEPIATADGLETAWNQMISTCKALE